MTRRLCFLALSFLMSGTAAIAGQRVLLPGAAHSSGLEGTFWKTEIWLTNLGQNEVSVPWLVLPSDESTCVRPAVLPPEVAVPAGTTVRLSDPLADGPAQGFLELDLPPGVLTEARTVNDTGEGAFGQRVSPIRGQDFFPADRTVKLVGLVRSGLFRTNLFILSSEESCSTPDSESLTVDVSARAASGAVLAESTLSVPRRGQGFVLDVFQHLGIGDCDNCRLDLRADEPIFPFASIIDNRTGDPTFVSPAE